MPNSIDGADVSSNVNVSTHPGIVEVDAVELLDQSFSLDHFTFPSFSNYRAEDVTYLNETTLRSFPSPQYSINPRMELQPHVPRAFGPRRMRYQQLSLNRKYVICTLCAYPQMLFPGKAGPPFVHSNWFAAESLRGARNGRISPLTSCSGIITMWSSKNVNNTRNIWRTIRCEQEFISKEV